MGYLIELDSLPGSLIVWPQPLSAAPVVGPRRKRVARPPDHPVATPTVNLPRSKKRPLASGRIQKPPPRIEIDTPLVPDAVAVAVLEEATVWLAESLPRSWRNELAERANAIYARNAQFRQRIRGPGTRGRDCLWAFTRHWLAGLLCEHRPHLYERLPDSYYSGYPLPEKTFRAG